MPTALARLPFVEWTPLTWSASTCRRGTNATRPSGGACSSSAGPSAGSTPTPQSTIEGRDALVDAIAEFHQNRPDVRIEVRGPVDEFGRHFRFVWATVDGEGEVLREGIDVGQLDEDGRIMSIVGFFGIVP
jgi:hypothetical protein